MHLFRRFASVTLLGALAVTMLCSSHTLAATALKNDNTRQVVATVNRQIHNSIQTTGTTLTVTDELQQKVLSSTKGRKASKSQFKKQFQKLLFVRDSSSLTLIGDTEDYDVTFKSSDTSILRVDKVSDNTCDYYGIAAGKATITIRIKNKNELFFWNRPLVLRAKITVSPRAVSVKFRHSKYKIIKGRSRQLRTTIRPSITKEKPNYQSLNPSIATVNAKGVVRARSEGTAYITATLANGMQSKCKIIVKKQNGTS